MIGTRASRETGVHIGSYRLYTVNTDVAGQQTVELHGKRVGQESGIGIEVGCHHTGMDTCIGTSGTRDADRLAQEERQAAFEFALHGDAVGLVLPTVIPFAIVAKPNEIAHHARR